MGKNMTSVSQIRKILEDIRKRLAWRKSGNAKISEKLLDNAVDHVTIKSRKNQQDGAPMGNTNAAGPHKGKGKRGYVVSKKEREKITKRFVGKKSSKGTVVTGFSDHAFDRLGGRMISPGRLQKMLDSTDTKPDKTYPDRTLYNIPGSRLVLADNGTVVTVMWRS